MFNSDCQPSSRSAPRLQMAEATVSVSDGVWTIPRCSDALWLCRRCYSSARIKRSRWCTTIHSDIYTSPVIKAQSEFNCHKYDSGHYFISSYIFTQEVHLLVCVVHRHINLRALRRRYIFCVVDLRGSTSLVPERFVCLVMCLYSCVYSQRAFWSLSDINLYIWMYWISSMVDLMTVVMTDSTGVLQVWRPAF